jgi:hypothetical protein
MLLADVELARVDGRRAEESEEDGEEAGHGVVEWWSGGVVEWWIISEPEHWHPMRRRVVLIE